MIFSSEPKFTLANADPGVTERRLRAPAWHTAARKQGGLCHYFIHLLIHSFIHSFFPLQTCIKPPGERAWVSRFSIKLQIATMYPEGPLHLCLTRWVLNSPSEVSLHVESVSLSPHDPDFEFSCPLGFIPSAVFSVCLSPF